MHSRVAIDLRCRSLEDFHFQAFGEAQHVDRADHAGLGRLHRIELIMDRRCGAGEIVDLIHFDKQRMRHIVPQEFEIPVVEQMMNIATLAGEKIIDAENFVAALENSVAKMGAQKTRSTSY